MNAVSKVDADFAVAAAHRCLHGGRDFMRLAALVLWGVLLAAPGVRAQGSRATEYQVKAAYMYNFALFVSWPEIAKSSSGPFGVCVLGEDPFGSILDSTFAGETLDGRSVFVERVANAGEARPCRILFISRSETKDLKTILSALNNAEVLTVSDIPDFSRRGGMIQFVWKGDSVRFEVNLAAAKSVGLVLSSDLLKVAAAVRTKTVSGS
ncbi:MAG: YfiR family protein [Candidatus Acidiferrales bacterium]